ncbi:hypothetical protein SAMN04488518_101351 [Pseudovibrio ascidiaceicola]|uniref:Uncharacterized protein n=1 Tax=Pseudovibrio ascidiaceicola TaxID=285279 RepID=A0A1I3VEU5_9HYPH|nr:hypothetical protein SAMN04488518_101351 [Pseudovibrio ascidiaceicola]
MVHHLKLSCSSRLHSPAASSPARPSKPSSAALDPGSPLRSSGMTSEGKATPQTTTAILHLMWNPANYQRPQRPPENPPANKSLSTTQRAIPQCHPGPRAGTHEAPRHTQPLFLSRLHLISTSTIALTYSSGSRIIATLVRDDIREQRLTKHRCHHALGKRSVR